MRPSADVGPNESRTGPTQAQSLRAGVPLITVIIPVFQVEELLHRCVDSVLGQTYSNIEVILIDDGSTDRSGAICDTYAAADPRVVVVHQENRGLSDARNVGLEVAQGGWITFVDSDDWIHKEMLQRLLEQTQQDCSELAICGFQKISETSASPDGIQGHASRVLSRDEAMRAYVGAENVKMTVAWGKLYQKDLFNGIRFPSGRLHEDEFTTHKVVWNSVRVSLLEARFYYYWQRPDSIMSTPSPRRITDARDGLLGKAVFFHDMGMEAEAASIVQICFWIGMRHLRLALAQGEDHVPRQVRAEARMVREQAAGVHLPPKFRLALLIARVAPRSLLQYLHGKSMG